MKQFVIVRDSGCQDNRGGNPHSCCPANVMLLHQQMIDCPFVIIKYQEETQLHVVGCFTKCLMYHLTSSTVSSEMYTETNHQEKTKYNSCVL